MPALLFDELESALRLELDDASSARLQQLHPHSSHQLDIRAHHLRYISQSELGHLEGELGSCRELRRFLASAYGKSHRRNGRP